MISLRRLAFASLLAAAAMVGGRADAALILEYDLAGQPGDQAASAPTSELPGVVASDLTRGPGLTPNAGDNSINSRGWTSAVTPDPGDYYEFSFVTATTPLSLA